MFGHSVPMGFVQASGTQFLFLDKLVGYFENSDINQDYTLPIISGSVVLLAGIFAFIICKKNKKIVSATEINEENEDELRRK